MAQLEALGRNLPTFGNSCDTQLGGNAHSLQGILRHAGQLQLRRVSLQARPNLLLVSRHPRRHAGQRKTVRRRRHRHFYEPCGGHQAPTGRAHVGPVECQLAGRATQLEATEIHMRGQPLTDGGNRAQWCAFELAAQPTRSWRAGLNRERGTLRAGRPAVSGRRT